jgi:hypothetical protein
MKEYWISKFFLSGSKKWCLGLSYVRTQYCNDDDDDDEDDDDDDDANNNNNNNNNKDYLFLKR